MLPLLGLGIFAILLFAWFLIEKSNRRTHPVQGGLQRDISIPYTDEFELYANAFSHCSRKTRLVLAETGIAYKYHQIDLIETGKYETISAHYLKVNPAGLVPTLVHKGNPVYESDDILSYISDHAPDGSAALVPADPALQVEMKTWVDRGIISSADPMENMPERAGSCIPALTLPVFVTAIRYIPLRRILVGFLFHPDKARPAFFAAAKLFGLRVMLSQKPVKSMVHQARDHMRHHLAGLVQQLDGSGGPWILGKQYTLADITWSCMILRLHETGWLDFYLRDPDLAAVGDYFVRLQARPSWKAAITEKAHPKITKAEADLKNATTEDSRVRAALYG